MRNPLRVLQHCVGFFILLVSISGCKFGLDAGVGEENSGNVTSETSAGSTVADKLRAQKLTVSGPAQLNNRVCSPTFTIWSRNGQGADSGVQQDHVLGLASSRSGLFFLDKDCRQSVSSVVLRQQTSSVSFYYRPNEVGNFQLSVQDHFPGGESLGSVNYSANSLNQLPLVSALVVSTMEEVPVTGRILASDPNGDSLEYQIATRPLHGTVTLNRTSGEFNYIPAVDYFGIDAFAIQALDGLGVSVPAQVTVTITGVEDSPSVRPSGGVVASGGEDQDIEISYLQVLNALDAADADGDTLRFPIENVLSGSLKVNGAPWSNTNRTLFSGQKLSWRPSPNQNGNLVAFSVLASDGKSTNGSSVTLKVEVTPANDAPTLAFTGVLSLPGASEDTDFAISFETLISSLGAQDPDGDVLKLIVDSVLDGTLLVNGSPWSGSNQLLQAGQSLTWRGPTNANGTLAAFTVAASDGSLRSLAVPISIVVQPVNDPPVAYDQEISVDNFEGAIYTGLLSGSDPDGSPLSYRLTAPRADVTLLDSGTGSFQFQVTSTDSLTDSFTFEVSDGELSRTGTVQVTKREILPADLTFAGSSFIKLAGWQKARALAYDSLRARYFVTGKQGNDSYLLAIRSNGSVDTSFGTSGSVLLGGWLETNAASIQIQNDYIYVSGIVVRNEGGYSNPDYFTAKLDRNGRFVTSFGANGWSLIDFPLYLATESHSVEDFSSAVISGSNIYLVGRFTVGAISYPAVAALALADGSVVSVQTFGAESPTPAPNSGFTGVATDGTRLALVGYAGSDTLVVAYRTDTRLFESNRIHSFGGAGAVTAISVQSSGKWLLAGKLNRKVFAARVHVDGSLDSSFGQNGIVSRSFGAATSVGASCVAANSSRIWLAGGADYSVAPLSRSLLMTLTTTGQSTLGSGPTAARSVSHGQAAEMDLCYLQSDGRLVVAGAFDGELSIMRHAP